MPRRRRGTRGPAPGHGGRPRGPAVEAITVRLPVDLLERVRAVLDHDGGSLTGLVRDAVVAEISRRGR